MRVHFPTNGARTALKIVYLSFLSDVINFSDVFCREERWILMHPDAFCREECFDSILSTFFIDFFLAGGPKRDSEGSDIR